jgi:predicted metal-dependent phosphoesterase TrpH
MPTMKSSYLKGKRWLKSEMHSHCSLDPVDYRMCPHSPEQLISEAARLGYEVLAITCHNLDIWTRDLSDYAASLGITLVPGMEVSTEGRRHTLVYNFRTGAENLNTLEKIRRRSREDTLVVAAHPYFPGKACLGSLLEQHVDVFDAIESSGFFAPGLDFNRRARAVAQKHRKPLVGNGDVHFLWQLGRTFTWIYAEPSVSGILGAVKRGNVRVESQALAYLDLARWWATALWRRAFPIRPAPTRAREKGRNKSAGGEDSILALRGLGREIWADEDVDSYVRRVREGWEI